METAQLLETVRDYSRRYASGEDCKSEMVAAQRAYDLARTAPERAAEADRQRESWVAQQAVWGSISEDDVPRIRQMALAADCIREAVNRSGFREQTVTLLVPPTSHWAGWQDNDAIVYHGSTAANLVERFVALSTEPWDGTYGHLWDFEGLS